VEKGCYLEPGAMLPNIDFVFFRIMSFNVSYYVKKQIINHLQDPRNYPKIKIDVQEGFFKPRRIYPDGSIERGTSVDWAACTMPETVVKNHNTKHNDENFGVLKIKVDGIHKIEFLEKFLLTEYNPQQKNLAHSLILGFPDEKEAENTCDEEFLTLRQQISEIAQWELFPSIIQP